MEMEVTASGFCVGLLVGLTGMGGALIMTPLMMFFFGIHPTVAVGTDFLYSAITKLFGAWQHGRQGSVDWAVVKWLSLGSVPSAVCGVVTMMLLQHVYAQEMESIMKHILGVVYLLIALVMLWRLRGRRQLPGPEVPFDATVRKRLVLLGLCSGYIVGLTSVGSGTLIMAMLLLIYPVSAARLVGTDIVQAVLVTGIAGLIQLAAGNVNVRLAAELLLGSIPGILLGSRLTVKISDLTIRVLLLLLISFAGMKILFG